MAKIDHLGIAVSSIAQARRLYEALGLTVLEEPEEDEGVRSVMIPLGESRLRLLEALDKNTTLAKFLEQRGEGLQPPGAPCGRHLGRVRRDEAGGHPAHLR